MTGAAQTMAAWSKVIESREEIPAIYKNCFEQFIGREQSFPHVVLTPSLNKFPRKTTEKLICDIGDAIYIFEKRNGNQISATSYLYSDICEVELGIVLLDSWLTIGGKTSLGEPGVSKIEFNTTSLRHFQSILSKLRPSPKVMDKIQVEAQKDKFNSLSTTNFKFMNYGRESILPGESVLQFLLQPEIRQPRWTVFGRTFYKTISLAHFSIITDRELILIRDAERNAESKISRYSGVWQYIPLHCISSVKIFEAANQRLTLSIQCHSGKTIEKPFESSKQPELQQFCSLLQTLI